MKKLSESLKLVSSKKRNVTMITNSTQRSILFKWMCVSSFWCGTLFSAEVLVILVATKENNQA